MMLQCRKMGDGTMSILHQHVVNQLQVLLSIMVRYGILVFAAVLRRYLPERVARPGPFHDTAPVGLRRTGCTALARLFQANGMNSVLRSRYPRHAMFGPRLKNHGFRPQAAFGAVKTGRFLQNESPPPSGIGPARCGPRILIMRPGVMYAFSSLGEGNMASTRRTERGAGQSAADFEGPFPFPDRGPLMTLREFASVEKRTICDSVLGATIMVDYGVGGMPKATPFPSTCEGEFP